MHGAKKGGKAKTITYDVFRLSLSRFNGVVCEYWRRKWFLISFFSVQFLHQRIGKINDGTKQNDGLISVGIMWVMIFFPNWCTINYSHKNGFHTDCLHPVRLDHIYIFYSSLFLSCILLQIMISVVPFVYLFTFYSIFSFAVQWWAPFSPDYFPYFTKRFGRE